MPTLDLDYLSMSFSLSGRGTCTALGEKSPSACPKLNRDTPVTCMKWCNAWRLSLARHQADAKPTAGSCHQLFKGAGKIEMFQIGVRLPKGVRNLHAGCVHE